MLILSAIIFNFQMIINQLVFLLRSITKFETLPIRFAPMQPRYKIPHHKPIRHH